MPGRFRYITIHPQPYRTPANKLGKWGVKMKINYDWIVLTLTAVVIAVSVVALYHIAGRAIDHQIEQNNRYIIEVSDGRVYE